MVIIEKELKIAAQLEQGLAVMRFVVDEEQIDTGCSFYTLGHFCMCPSRSMN